MNENQIADIWMLFKEYVDRAIFDTDLCFELVRLDVVVDGGRSLKNK